MSGFLRAFFAEERRAWRGEMPLARVFWGYGVLLSLALAALTAMALLQGHWLTCQLLLMAAAVYTVWIVVSVWRCAGRADPYWGIFARWLTVAWALNAAMMLAFLQVEVLKVWL